MPRRIPPKVARKAELNLNSRNVYIALGAILTLFVLAIAHTPWMIYQIRKPVYEATCEVGKKQDFVLHMIGAQNLTADRDAELLAAVRIPSGSGSIPINEIRVDFGRTVIDLDEHPAWERLITPLKTQDSAANMVVMHNLSYCNMPEPWTIWPRSSKQFRFPVNREPLEVEYAEAS